MRNIVSLKSASQAVIAGLVCASLTACSLAPEYQTPAAPISQHWFSDGEDISQPESSAKIGWKSFVTDENLVQLIELTLQNNHDLRQVILNVEAARAQYGIQDAQRLPNVNLEGQASRQATPDDFLAPGMPNVQNRFQVGVGLASYELDLFQRVSNLSQAALHEYLATAEVAQSLKTSLIAEVIQSYLAYNGAQQRYLLAKQVKESRATSEQKIRQRLELGAASKLELQQAIELRLNAALSFERISREKQLAYNALRLLVGVSDIDPFLSDKPQYENVIVQELTPGAPSDLLQNRPDIRAAEHRLIGRNANIGAARAAFFPSISLTGFVGTSSTEISDLFSSSQKTWSFAPQIRLPIFDGGRNQANLDLANIRKDISIVEYEQNIQTAFREVADALVSIDSLKREESVQRELSLSSADRLILSYARYQRGADDYLNYLDTQRESFANHMALIQVKTQRQIALVSLYRALGGGWMAQDS
ncbi:efflux transporter outer membrane subunit [Glaciecola sp. 1036]|uniref:efflux transporter outer membrane subunit n=1 Tax=Alteromonadaceae TaxID=72275 RepID=UPI003D088C0E